VRSCFVGEKGQIVASNPGDGCAVLCCAVLCYAVLCCAAQGHNLTRVVLVDNDDYKAADGEHENMLHVPHWEQTQGECCRCCRGAGGSCGNSANRFGTGMEQQDPAVVCSFAERCWANGDVEARGGLSGNAR
jgi:hypothetical protein